MDYGVGGRVGGGREVLTFSDFYGERENLFSGGRGGGGAGWRRRGEEVWPNRVAGRSRRIGRGGGVLVGLEVMA